MPLCETVPRKPLTARKHSRIITIAFEGSVDCDMKKFFRFIMRNILGVILFFVLLIVIIVIMYFIGF